MFAAALLVHRGNLARALLGWDTYATLAAARVTSGADLVGTFTEKLMDGRLAFGDFYRPVGNLFIALDVAVWGIDPFGHQLTSTLLFAALCALVFVVVQQRQCSSEIAPAAWAAILVVLHPASLSILPVVSRRTEILMIFFMLAALAAARWRGVSEGWRSLLAGVFALLAIGSKEPGLVVLPLLAVDRFLAPRQGEEDGAIRPRLVSTLRFVAPAAVAIASFMALRALVLGGLGGYFSPPVTPYVARLASHTPDYLGMVMVTGVLDAAGLGAALGLVSFAAVAAGCAVLWRSRNGEGGPAELALPALGLAWIGAQLALASTAEKPEPRYVEGLVVGLSLVLAGFVDTSRVRAAAARTAGGGACRQARVLLAAVLVVSLSALAGAPLWRAQPALAEASSVQAEELAELEARLRALPPGDHRERVRVRKLYGSTDRAVDHAWMLSPWGVQAWLELVFPDRRFTVERDDLKRPEPTHWNLVVVEHAPEPGH